MLIRLLLMVPFVGQLIVVSWKLYWDKRVSVFLKILPTVAVLYILSPIDPIPDFRLGLGQLDDIIVAGTLFLLFVIWSPKRIVSEHAGGRKNISDEDTKTIETDYRYLDEE